MADRPSNWGVSFQAKVLAPVIITMAALLMITMWIMDHRIRTQMEAEAANRLSTAEAVFQSTQKIRAKNLLLRYRNLPNEPRFRANLQTGDTATIRAHLRALLDESDADAFAFFSDKASLIANVSRESRMKWPEFESGSVAAVERALGGEPFLDTIPVADSLLDLIAVPVLLGSNNVIGVIVVATDVGNAVAQEFRALTSSEIVFVARDRVVASTFSSPGFNQEFIRLFYRGPAQTGASEKIEVGGEHFLWRVNLIPTLRGDAKLGCLLFSSYEQSWRSFQTTRQILAWSRVIGLLAAATAVWLLIRKVTQPLRELRDGAEAVGRGDFSRRVAVTTNDECGELAHAFNQMTENLNASRMALEKTVETLKTTQAQLFQREKLSAIGQFVAGVTHELNNPLTSVIGFAELLKQIDSDPRHQRYVDNIVSNSQRCHKIVQSLLSFARQRAPERKFANLNDLVENTLSFLQYELRTSNIAILRQLDPELPPVFVDAHQVQQVFLNLITNASQAMQAHRNAGELRITTESLPGKVRVTFEDNGPGIPEENLPKIFDPFFTTKEVGKGTGLGLSLCYGIVQEHGGTIVARSTPGKGSTFVVDLPAAREARPVETPSSSSAPSPAPNVPVEPNGKRILAIDDEEDILELINDVLTAGGYDVQTARDGETGLQRLATSRFDLILCDWKMPGLNGEQVYERLCAIDPAAAKRFVFMTGDVINERTQRFLRDNGKLCVAKPFSLEEFQSIVRGMSRQ
jgi:two-component system, NtrC family, sensor kinase